MNDGLILNIGELAELVVRAGFKKGHMPISKAIIAGCFAGSMLAFGGQMLCAVVAETNVKLIGACFFATALLLIVSFGGELFTGNVMMSMTVLCRRLYLWEWLTYLCIMWLANFFGCILFAVIFWGSGVNGYSGSLSPSGVVMCSTVSKKSLLAPHEAFLRGIGCNILVCVAILFAVASKTPTGKVLGCMLPIACFVEIGFEHCIANMFFFSVGTLLRCDQFLQGDAWPRLILVSLGNFVGAGMLSLTIFFSQLYGTPIALAEVPRDTSSNTEGLFNKLPRSTANKSMVNPGFVFGSPTDSEPIADSNPC